MEIRDPIHGFISYDPVEEKIINSGLFQRLRNIKQLALASYVYPGAHHTRFEHSIGAMHLAGKVAEKLGLDTKVRILRLAGLLHDIGHGPFSHISEQILEKYAGDIPKKYKADNAHELMSILLIKYHPDINSILGQSDIDDITQLLQKQSKRSVEKDIISGPIDVDKIDYLLRDSYFAGVHYGSFDQAKVIDSFISVNMGTDGVTLGIDEEGIYSVEQLLLAKYHMNAQVYQHRIRRITDAMLVRGIEFAIQEGIQGIRDIFFIKDTAEFVKSYVESNDDNLFDIILSKGKGAALKYYQRIKERRLLKEVFFININDRVFPDPIILDHIRQISDEQINSIVGEASSTFSFRDNKVDNDLIIVDKQTVRNPTFKSPGARIDSNTIMVKTKLGRLDFPTASSIFKNSGVDPQVEMLYIYLPLDWIKESNARREYIKEKYDKMKQKIEEIAR
jgi:uncharacterized protein